ncbi:MAG: lipopolysaccharide assembly protein LapB [Gammaproteobacteria bacterium]|nr:lipopolysaccharide assembly protein LapB [Gammaproteobacteria bacterium]
MLLESLFLLLPVAAVSGWVAGRRGKQEIELAPKTTISPIYLKGLNYLLNEQPDKAIDVFIQLLEVDTETIETHLALGSLFRRRGEVDRAIRIHQNLIARPNLTKEQRSDALFELGQDYLRAGLLDRAESLFSDLISHNPHTEIALNHLIDIYQQERDWEKAIETARRLEVKTGNKQFARIAHYYCELAEQAERSGDKVRAQKLIKKALTTNRASVRASLLEGKLAMQSGNDKAAIKAWLRIEQQDKAYLAEAIPLLVECYQRLGRNEELSEYLEQLMSDKQADSTIVILSKQIQKENGENAAATYLTETLKAKPSVQLLDRLVELNIKQVSDTESDKLQVIKDVTWKLLSNSHIYQCNICGFSSRQLYWQCPGCRSWESLKPIHGLEGE